MTERFKNHQIPHCVEILGILGDVNAAEYGGGVVFVYNDGQNQSIEVEYCLGDESSPTREVNRFVVEPDVFADLRWVNWGAIRNDWPMNWEPLEVMGKSPNPVDRARVYVAVADYHGWANLDGYPMHYSYAGLCRRWYGEEEEV